MSPSHRARRRNPRRGSTVRPTCGWSQPLRKCNTTPPKIHMPRPLHHRGRRPRPGRPQLPNGGHRLQWRRRPESQQKQQAHQHRRTAGLPARRQGYPQENQGCPQGNQGCPQPYTPPAVPPQTRPRWLPPPTRRPQHHKKAVPPHRPRIATRGSPAIPMCPRRRVETQGWVPR